MNTKCSILTGLFTLLITFSGISQEIIEKNYFDSNKKIGKDVLIKKSTVKVEGSKTYKIFEIESPDNGNYYMNAWIMGGEYDSIGSGKFLEYDLSVNNEKQNEKFKPEKNNWHNTAFKDGKLKEKKTVKLKKGQNQIVFSCDAPEIPEIEFIRLSKDKTESDISEENYTTFIDDLKQNARKEKEKEKDTIKIDTLGMKLKSAVLSNPAGNYYHHVDVNFKYTWYKTVYHNSGEELTVRVWSDLPVVIEVFSSSNPETYSWSKLGYDDDEAILYVTIPSSGTYYVRVRAYYQESYHTANIRLNGTYYNNCPVSGSGFRHAHETPTTYNYFTCKLSGDSRIWITDDTWPGKIKAYNDDYNGGGGDFSWGLASRVKKDFSVRIGAALISSYSSYNPTGTCDLYMKCENSNITSYFPNLKADDAIQSAPASGTYNCISWSGGITNYWEWPLSQWSNYCEEVYDAYGNFLYCDPLPSFDNYYEAERYSNAMTYSRSGATASNNTVDLWVLNGNYTHGSVTKPGNDHPHGYDWESKPGGLMRTFHPRNALNGSSYGAVDKYYRITSGLKSAMLLDESIARGLSVIENVELTATEKQEVSESIDKLSIGQKSNLEAKYEAWKDTWDNLDVAIHSNPRMYAKSKEYDDFIDYCESLGEESWLFVFDKFEQGDFFVINALEDLTLADNMEVLEKVKSESNLKSATSSGATIVRSPQTYAMKYIKELLKSTGEVTSTEDDGIIYSNSFDFSVYPNPANTTSQIAFNLPYDAKVSVEVIDLTGKVLSVPQQNQYLTKGDYNYQLNVPEGFKGTCLVKLRINNNVNIQLLVVE